MVVAFFAGRTSVGSDRATSPVDQFSAGRLPLIDAVASVSSEDYSIATGQVSDRAEGFFVLDHNSGLLRCNVIYPRVGKFMGSFSTNVADAMGTAGKGGKYMMVTGMANFQGDANNRLAPTVLYILDTATGNYVCYGVPFNQAMQNSRQTQQRQPIPIAQGGANMVPDRDRLR